MHLYSGLQLLQNKIRWEKVLLTLTLLMMLVISIGCSNDELEKVKPKDIEDPPPLGMALIPAGSFEMGDHLDNVEKALPMHTVELDAFHMDVNEVTVGQSSLSS